MSSLAPVLLMQQVDENLRKLHVNKRDIRALLNDTRFSSIFYKSHEVCFIQQYFCQTLYHKGRKNTLAVLRELNPRTVCKYLLRGRQESQVPGRLRALDETSESELTTMTIQAFSEGKAMTKTQVLELIVKGILPG
jgi:hypothetical protein